MPNKDSEPKRKKTKARASKIHIDSNVFICGIENLSCSCAKREESGELKPVMLIRIAVSAVLIVAGIFIPLPQVYKSVIFALSILTIGYDMIIYGFINLFKGRILNQSLLMIISVIIAFAGGLYPEGAAVILIFRIGELIEEYAIGSSRKSIRRPTEIKSERAVVLRDGSEISVFANTVNAGETIIVRQGERIPLDGILMDSRTTLDTSAITGESMPRTVNAGDQLYSGSINIGAMFRMQVTAPYEKSTLSRILEIMESANLKRSKPERFISLFSKYYTPVILAATVIAFFVLTFVFKHPPVNSLRRALVLLVVSSPCALAISVPLTYFAGIGGAARRGILFRTASAVDDMSKVSSVVFDKTGTLTTGKYSVTSVESAYVNRDMLLMLTAYAEYYSKHPLARSVVAAYGGQVDTRRINNFKELTGKGVKAKVSSLAVMAGTADFLNGEGISVSSRDSGESTVYVAANGRYLGRIMLSDNLKRDAVRAVDTLRQLGVDRVVMMTGDRNRAAMKSAVSLGIKEVYAEYLPSDKAMKLGEIMEEQASGRKTAFVGEYISDTQVLASADIGITMGGMASDEAIEASDVIIMSDEPAKISSGIKIAKETKTIVRQNIILSLGYKILIILLGLYGFAPIWLAVLGDAAVSILAILNAMRAYDLNRKLLQLR